VPKIGLKYVISRNTDLGAERLPERSSSVLGQPVVQQIAE